MGAALLKDDEMVLQCDVSAECGKQAECGKEAACGAAAQGARSDQFTVKASLVMAHDACLPGELRVISCGKIGAVIENFGLRSIDAGSVYGIAFASFRPGRFESASSFTGVTLFEIDERDLRLIEATIREMVSGGIRAFTHTRHFTINFEKRGESIYFEVLPKGAPLYGPAERTAYLFTRSSLQEVALVVADLLPEEKKEAVLVDESPELWRRLKRLLPKRTASAAKGETPN